MKETEPVWCFSQEAFLRWLREGVYCLPKSHLDDAQPVFWIQLPAKYGRLAGGGGSFLALIDEIEAISLASPELTNEWQIRLRNQGEGWLPFCYRSEWFSTPEMNANRPSTESVGKTDGETAPRVTKLIETPPQPASPTFGNLSEALVEVSSSSTTKGTRGAPKTEAGERPPKKASRKRPSKPSATALQHELSPDAEVRMPESEMREAADGSDSPS